LRGIKEEALVGERAKAVKHSDNLKVEGAHDMTRVVSDTVVGQRAAVVRHEDNLRMEGSFEGNFLFR